MAGQVQVAELLKSLLDRGIEAKEAFPVVKSLIEAKIFSLNDITAATVLPTSIPAKLHSKLRPKRKKSAASTPSERPRKKQPPPPAIQIPPSQERPERILVNRSPVYTLWAAIVAQCLYDLSWEEALSFGSALASVTAKANGTRLGIFAPEDTKEEVGEQNDLATGEVEETAKLDVAEEIPTAAVENFNLLGGVISARKLDDCGWRAMGSEGRLQDPYVTWRLLQRRFGTALGFVIEEMMAAANSALRTNRYSSCSSDANLSAESTESNKDHLASTAYEYYLHVRPDVPCGTKGWGAHGFMIAKKLRNFYETK